MTTLRNRILRHQKVKANELLPHEKNPRIHSSAQKALLSRLYEEIGFARSLLAFELPNGKLKLIDGHLRADLTPDRELEVEVLDVTEKEAEALLLAIDPLAQMAQEDAALLAELQSKVEKSYPFFEQMQEQIQQAEKEVEERIHESQREPLPEQHYMVLIECQDEQQQIALLERFQAEGLTCKALLS